MRWGCFDFWYLSHDGIRNENKDQSNTKNWIRGSRRWKNGAHIRGGNLCSCWSFGPDENATRGSSWLYKSVSGTCTSSVGHLPHSNYLLDPYFTPWYFSKRCYFPVINDSCDRLSLHPLLAVFWELAKMSMDVVSPNYLPFFNEEIMPRPHLFDFPFPLPAVELCTAILCGPKENDKFL